MFRFLSLIFISFVLGSSAFAQSVRWEANDSGDPSELQLIFEDCTPEGEPQIPQMEGTTLALLGTSSQTTINNFKMSRSTLLSYRARSQRSGPIQIPSFAVATNRGSLRVPAFTGGAARSAADANISSRLEPASISVWAGEVFPLKYVLDVARRSFNQLGSTIEWNPTPLVVEEWSKFEPTESTVGGESRLYVGSTTRAYAKASGTVALNAASQLVNIQSGSVGFGLFQTPRIEQLSVTSNRPSLVVRPLPSAPAGFSGAVGQFKLTSKVVPANAAVGEPVTWTLELSGAGNWPDIAGLPSRNVSKDFNVVQPQAKRTPSDGKLFDAVLSEDVVLVPTREGSYVLGPVEFVYFDPASSSYKTASTPRTSVSITPVVASPAASPAAPGQQPVLEATGSSRVSLRDLKASPAPVGIPREPLGGTSPAIVPLPFKQLVTFVLLPFGALPLVWGWFAFLRARKTDPLRARREAYGRIVNNLGHLRSATGTTRSRLLLAWQHDSAVLWEIPHAAPAPVALPDPAWSALWLEAEHALYSGNPSLSSDWQARAESALASRRVPGFSPLRLFLPKNLLPFVAIWFLVVASAPLGAVQGSSTVPAGPSADTAYRTGDFTGAEKRIHEALTQNPADAVARYNLSLALAQQDRWNEAAAHATAAFVQDPSNQAVKAQLALCAEKAGFIPSPVARFLPPGPVQSLAGLTSPGVWQICLIAASFLFVTALGILLLGLYRSPSRPRTATGLSLLGVATLLAFSSIASLQAYGLSADSRSVIAWKEGILRSIPTEADTTQKTTTLAAGSTAIENRTFLGWALLTFENGQTGWVRKEDVISIWK